MWVTGTEGGHANSGRKDLTTLLGSTVEGQRLILPAIHCTMA
jgi:hypothetical protein